MHTKAIVDKGGCPGDVRIHHTSDGSGDAILQWSNATEAERVRVPGFVARSPWNLRLRKRARR
jgi:hypothetical protein